MAGDDESLPGRLGRFVILDEVGRGGMAVVYAAYDPQLDRRVALKMLRPLPGAAPGDARERLVHEAQALARINHPNVATVYDVGVVDERVFLAQELVDGGTLEAWLAAAPRGWDEIVRIFVLAGRGLCAAHEAGLVHRDFKPANVLLGKDGRVRVTDFGLARAATDLDATPTPGAEPVSPARDRAGAAVGTPVYMPPEQARGGPPDPRSDQFSFCVALWQAVYGAHPFGAGNFAERQSNAISGLVTPPAEASRAPAWLGRTLERGLKPRPEERYPELADLLAALERTPSRGQRRAVAATAVVLLLGSGAVGGYLLRRDVGGDEVCADATPAPWGEARRDQVARALAATGVSYAGDAAARVDAALATWTRAYADTRREACEATRVHGTQSPEALDRRMACLDTRRQELDTLVDVLAHADAKVAEKAVSAALQLASPARCTLPAALAALALPTDVEAAARVRSLRERLTRPPVLESAGKYAEAVAAARPLLEEARLAGYEPVRAEAALKLGSVLIKTGELDAAETALLEALSVGEATGHGEVATRAAVSLIYLIGYVQGNVKDALRWGELARGSLAHLGRDEPVLGSALECNLGTALFAAARYDEAATRFKTCLGIRERSLPAGHPDLAYVHNAMGAVLEGQGKNAEGAREQGLALALYEQSLGKDHPQTAIALTNLGRILMQLERFDEAQAIQQRAMTIALAVYGPHHSFTASVGHNLTELDLALGRFDEALARGLEVRALRLELLGPDHADVARMRHYVADALVGLRRWSEAEPEYQLAVAGFEKAYGKDSYLVAYPVMGLGRALLQQGKVAQALPLLERARALREAAKDKVDPAVLAQTRALVARAQWEAGRDRPAALALARAAAEGMQEGGAGDAQSKRDREELAAWLKTR